MNVSEPVYVAPCKKKLRQQLPKFYDLLWYSLDVFVMTCITSRLDQQHASLCLGGAPPGVKIIQNTTIMILRTIHPFVQITKGASKKDVRSKLGFSDPFPPMSEL